jgi:hypothetical protein
MKLRTIASLVGFAVWSVLSLAAPAAAQLGGSGTVQGTVKDPTGA